MNIRSFTSSVRRRYLFLLSLNFSSTFFRSVMSLAITISPSKWSSSKVPTLTSTVIRSPFLHFSSTGYGGTSFPSFLFSNFLVVFSIVSSGKKGASHNEEPIISPFLKPNLFRALSFTSTKFPSSSSRKTGSGVASKIPLNFFSEARSFSSALFRSVMSLLTTIFPLSPSSSFT